MTQSLQALPAVPPSGSAKTSPALVCAPVFEEICINANGDIVCSSCDVNGQRVYGNVFKDRIRDVYNGPMYQEIREWLLKSSPDTWCPAINQQCPKRATSATSQYKASDCRVKVLQLEPVTYCNLQCTACPVESNFKQNPFLRDTRGHKLLPLATMLDVVEQLPDLELILYFNYGEPFLHKDTVQFLRAVKRKRPTIQIMTSTNGLVMTPTQIKAIAEESLMDRVIFSIDGANPASYRKYRVGGDLSKALNKMMSLVEACRAAGTWRRLVTDPPGGVQITWQYILFEWNDSDEELSQAKQIAAGIGVPIKWVITCGYGASKRFLAGSTEAARLMNGSESFVLATPQANLANCIGLGAFDFDVYKNIQVICELLSLPYIEEVQQKPALRGFWKSRTREVIAANTDNKATQYQARIRSPVTSIAAPRGAPILFQIDVQNRTYKAWDLNKPNFLRLGVLLQTTGNEAISELPGLILPATIAKSLGRDTVALRAKVPSKPGSYKLKIDVVHESVCWFSDHGSSPLEISLQVE